MEFRHCKHTFALCVKCCILSHFIVDPDGIAGGRSIAILAATVTCSSFID